MLLTQPSKLFAYTHAFHWDTNLSCHLSQAGHQKFAITSPGKNNDCLWCSQHWQQFVENTGCPKLSLMSFLQNYFWKNCLKFRRIMMDFAAILGNWVWLLRRVNY